jgi:hypothetical protein
MTIFYQKLFKFSSITLGHHPWWGKCFFVFRDSVQNVLENGNDWAERLVTIWKKTTLPESGKGNVVPCQPKPTRGMKKRKPGQFSFRVGSGCHPYLARGGTPAKAKRLDLLFNPTQHFPGISRIPLFRAKRPLLVRFFRYLAIFLYIIKQLIDH